MGGDHSKDSFDSLRDFAGVFLQQGRPVLDSDWNEMVQILERRIRAGTVDTIGRAVVPRETENGFHIQNGTSEPEIGPGRLYLHGMLVENHGNADFAATGATGLTSPVFDRGTGAEISDPLGVLDEMTSLEDGYVPYSKQPYWPTPDAVPETEGPMLAYLVAWQREVTPVKDPSLLDPALGGVDSATRWQTVWQVRFLSGIGMGADCTTPEGALNGWDETIAPSTARLTTDTAEVDNVTDPCLVPPTDGYTGLENQLYRVEIHESGQDGAQANAWFKFSRENASVAVAIESFGTPADTITVRTLGRDDLLRFQEGNWVEVTDDRREFNHRSGQMLKVIKIIEETLEIELSGTVDTDLIPTGIDGDTAKARHSRLIRWDQEGKTQAKDAAGNWVEWWDLDADNGTAPDGLIPVPPDGREVLLESGITLSFSTATGPGRWREMDAWRFWARTAGTQIQILNEAPPDVVQRHYTKLATFSSTGAEPMDCRTFWPPDLPAAGEGCACSVCVTPASHASGDLTIQMGIDQVAEAGGGTVCLDPGRYLIDAPITMHNLFGVTLRGHGITTVIDYRNATETAIEIKTCIDTRVENLSILVSPEGTGAAAAAATAHGITARHTATLALRRLAIVVAAAGGKREDHGIELEGIVMGAKIEECLVAAPFPLGSLGAVQGFAGATGATSEDAPSWLALAELQLLDNVLFGGRHAVRLGGLAFSLTHTTFARNVIWGPESGLTLDWCELPSGGTSVEGNTIFSEGNGALIGINEIMIENNAISGGPVGGNGLWLVPNVVPDLPLSAQVIGNRISDLGGAGLRIGASYDRLLVKRNMIRNCGFAGILTDPDVQGRHLAIEDNVINAIPGAPDGVGGAGISVLGVLEGQILGNSIRGVGREAPGGALIAGIAVQGFVAMSIEGNTIYEIGPDTEGATAWGVVVRPPLSQLAVNGNRIDGTITGTEVSTAWKAIEIGLEADVNAIGKGNAPTGDFTGAAGTIPGASADAIGFAVVDDVLFTVSNRELRAFIPMRPSQVRTSGNQVMHFATPLAIPAVVTLRGPTVIDFSQNQFDCVGNRDVEALVAVAGERITAQGNSVRHALRDFRSVLLLSSAVAPIGNITSGDITVSPGGMPPAFAALNLTNV